MTELPRQLAAALRSHLQRCPRTAAGESDADRHLQQSDRVTKSLNVSPAYASHLHSGIRELVQNWYDQCKASTGSNASLAVQDLTPAAAARAGGLLLVATAGRRSCGYLALSSVRKSASTCDVQLCNYGSTVSLAAMTLGESSKQEQGIQFAGHFGEVRQRSGTASACRCLCGFRLQEPLRLLHCREPRWRSTASRPAEPPSPTSPATRSGASGTSRSWGYRCERAAGMAMATNGLVGRLTGWLAGWLASC